MSFEDTAEHQQKMAACFAQRINGNRDLKIQVDIPLINDTVNSTKPGVGTLAGANAVKLSSPIGVGSGHARD